MRQILQTDAAPAPIGSYSQAVRVGNTVYLAGQVGLHPVSGQLVSGGVSAELAQIFQNMQGVLAAAHGSLSDIVSLTVYVLTLDAVPALNAAIATHFTASFPARTTIAVVGLPAGAQVEITATAVV